MNYEEIKELRKWLQERNTDCTEGEINKMLYIANIEDIVEQRIVEKRNEVEVWSDGGEINLENNTTEMYVKTLTEYADPEVNAYGDGMDEIWYARRYLEDILQCEIVFTKDIDVGGDDYSTWINHHGYFTIKISGDYEYDEELNKQIKNIEVHEWYSEFQTHEEIRSTLNKLPKKYREEFVNILLNKGKQNSKTIRENFQEFKEMIE